MKYYVAVLLLLVGCQTSPPRTWKVEAINQQGEVMQVWEINCRSRPRPTYQTWGGTLTYYPHIEVPIGWMLRVTEVER